MIPLPCPRPLPPAKLGLKPEAVRQFYLRNGYSVAHNNSNNLYRIVEPNAATSAHPEDRLPTTYRICISQCALRKEVKVPHALGKSTWMRVRSGYLKNLWIWNNQIFGLTTKGCQ